MKQYLSKLSLCSAAVLALLVGGTAAQSQTPEPATTMKMRPMPGTTADRQTLMAVHQDAMAILETLERNPAMKRELAAATPEKATAMLRAAGATRAETITVTPNPGPTGEALTITITIKLKNITITITIKI